MNVIPATAIIPTANRSSVLLRTLESVALQSMQPQEIMIIDASDNDETNELCKKKIPNLRSDLLYKKAIEKGAAIQRSQGVENSTQAFIFFMDDDIILKEACIENLWNCLKNHPEAAGVNALVINQQYHVPGRVSKFMYRWMNGKKLDTYAGKCIGPAWNLLPQDSGSTVNEVEWLNTTCTLYRKESLPTPLFPSLFKGYSLMEDVALSLTIGKKWKLYNMREAKIFHDSQPGSHKNAAYTVSKMEFLNRHFIMVNIMGRSGFRYHVKLLVFECWGIASSLTGASGWKKLIPVVLGKLAASFLLLVNRK